ncbi:MAG TPA: type IV pilin protein [Steroidobacteraceae bacterium]|nr:type IV pilin protein [Steroidobacteraceae bacterium]
MAQARAAAGFTLIEVVIALAVVAITTAIAATTYRNHLRRSHRAEAVYALLLAATEQEKFHLAHGSYGNRLDAAAGDDPPGLPVASRTPGGHYALAVATATAAEFRVVATAVEGGADPVCHTLSIDESGRRLATDARGADSARRCW